MITTSTKHWRDIQKTNITKLSDLSAILNIPLKALQTPSFPLNLPQRLAKKIIPSDHKDPILLQFLPSHAESIIQEGFSQDPVLDQQFQVVKKGRLLQKYHGRALLISTSACAMNCRFCFRQNYPYPHQGLLDKEFDAISSDPSLYEIILSGGDPLSLGDDKLASIIQRLEAIPHIKIIRFHTRFPIGIPERISDQFLHLLKNTSLQTVFVIHVNHPNELDDDILSALQKIQHTQTPVLSQTVLLRSVNDCSKTLSKLYLSLIAHGIIPYYLHQLDPVQQAHHFKVPIEKGLSIINALRMKLPGYAVPRYVQEIPHHLSKTPITSCPVCAAPANTALA